MSGTPTLSPDLSPQQLVATFGDADRTRRWEPVAALQAAGDGALEAIREGMSHPDWRVRRGCAVFVDHNPDPLLMERLLLLLRDPKAKVRMWAVHSLSCEPCKPGGNPVDAVPSLIHALGEDKAIRVRRMAAAMLAQQAPEPRSVEALRRALAVETDTRLRRLARWGLSRMEPGPTA
jgi:HEAT repeat protein